MDISITPRLPHNVCKYLSDVFGGTWKYDNDATWNCDDGRLVVRAMVLDAKFHPKIITYTHYSKHDLSFVINFDMNHDFCEQAKSEERTFGSTVCVDCNLYEPHVDLESPTRCEEMYKAGELKKEPASCSKWLCNCGGCPHSKPRIDRINNTYKQQVIKKYRVPDETLSTELTEEYLSTVPEHLREMVRLSGNNPTRPWKKEYKNINMKMFPVRNVITKHNNVALISEIPYELLEAYDETIKKRHGNSLDAFSKNGGLPASCIIAILEERDWCEMDVIESSMRLRDLLFERANNKNNFFANATISFNPSDSASVQSLLGLYGPEGLHAIAKVLIDAADKDMSDAMK